MRYFSQPKRPTAHWADDVPLLPCLSVDDIVAVNTGLITAKGDPIMRAPEPIGFAVPKVR